MVEPNLRYYKVEKEKNKTAITRKCIVYFLEPDLIFFKFSIILFTLTNFNKINVTYIQYTLFITIIKIIVYFVNNELVVKIII